MKEKSTNKDNKKIVIYWNVRKTIALICGLLFVPVFIVFIFSLTLKTTIANPQYYKDNLKSIDAYNRIVNKGIPSLILEMHVSDNKLTDSLAKELTVFLIQKFVDPVFIEDISETFIDKTIAFFQKSDQEINLDLSNYQKHLEKLSNGLLVLEEIIPDSTMTTETSDSTASASKIVTNLGEVKKDLGGIRLAIDKIDLGMVRADQTVKKINGFIQIIHKFMVYINVWLWACLAAMIILIGAIAFLQWKNLALIIKLVSFFTGIAAFLSLVIAFITDKLVPKSLGNQNILLSASIRGIIDDFLKITISGIFERLETYSAVILVISVAVFGSVLVVERKGIRFFKRLFKHS